MYDIGAFTGGILAGYISDLFKKRCLIIYPMLLISAFCCLVVKLFLTDQSLPYYFLILIIGIFLGGPYGIISGVISIDLSQ